MLRPCRSDPVRSVVLLSVLPSFSSSRTLPMAGLLPAPPAFRDGITIVGAGLFGCGLALELARRGCTTTLIDRDHLPLQRAARRNEGKIHLGLVYAAEAGAGTASLMLAGALRFRSIVCDWIGEQAWRRLSFSRPYHYLVHRDSLLPVAHLQRHYIAVQRLYAQMLQVSTVGIDYLGTCPDRLWRPLQRHELHAFSGAPIQAGFATAERAIDPDGLCDAISDRVLHEPAITWQGDTTVEAVQRQGGLLRIRGQRRGEPWESCQGVVVNGSWDSRLAIDRTMGLPDPPQHLLRLKYRLLVALPERLRGAPSQTLVLGRFGDIVIHPGGQACLSWYPAGLRGWTDAAQAPASWHRPCQGHPDPAVASAIAEATLRQLDPFLPGLVDATVQQVDAGVIVARGSSDVDDPASGLHSRTAIGLLHHGADGYLSVDQGKWTTAPQLARCVAERLMQPFSASGGR